MVNKNNQPDIGGQEVRSDDEILAAMPNFLKKINFYTGIDLLVMGINLVTKKFDPETDNPILKKLRESPSPDVRYIHRYIYQLLYDRGRFLV